MAKVKRGKNVKKIPGWRGTCPVCKRTRVKLLWAGTKEATGANVCKKCGK
jgi:hypothetical protein